MILDVYYYERKHRVPSEPVDKFDGSLRDLVSNLYETVDHLKAVGLAASQCLIFKRVAVVSVLHKHRGFGGKIIDVPERYALINPRIEYSEGEQSLREACLSLPGRSFLGKVKRARSISLVSYTLDGEEQRISADGFLAHAIQHELDHMDGKFFFDHLSPLWRGDMERRFAKLRSRRGIPNGESVPIPYC